MYSISIDSIGVYHRPAARKYELSRQPDDKSLSLGRIELFPKKNFEQALEGLSEFDRIWVVFSFDKSAGWNPKVRPPRGKKKIGLFATRSPHRPSSIGMSCVQLKGVSGRFLDVQGADLLDSTPILDIKPYIPYCDSFPDAKAGWVDSIMDSSYELRWSSLAIEQKDFLHFHGVFFSDYVFDLLKYFSGPNHYNRINHLENNKYVLAYKTWRIIFVICPDSRVITIHSFASGYQLADIDQIQVLQDKTTHSLFTLRYGMMNVMQKIFFPC